MSQIPEVTSQLCRCERFTALSAAALRSPLSMRRVSVPRSDYPMPVSNRLAVHRPGAGSVGLVSERCDRHLLRTLRAPVADAVGKRPHPRPHPHPQPPPTPTHTHTHPPAPATHTHVHGHADDTRQAHYCVRSAARVPGPAEKERRLRRFMHFGSRTVPSACERSADE